MARFVKVEYLIGPHRNLLQFDIATKEGASALADKLRDLTALDKATPVDTDSLVDRFIDCWYADTGEDFPID